MLLITNNFGMDVDAKAFLNRCSATSQADGDFVRSLNNIVLYYKGKNVWNALDGLFLCCPAQVDSLLNVKGTSFPSSAVGSPVFTSKKGFNINSSTKYIDTGYIPENSGSWARNDNFVFAQTIDPPSRDPATIISAHNNSGTVFTELYRSGSIPVGSNSCVNRNFTATPDQGFYAITRTSPSQFGVHIGTGPYSYTSEFNSTASVAAGWSKSIKIGTHESVRSRYWGGRISAWGFGNPNGAYNISSYLKIGLQSYLIGVGAI